DAARRKSAGGAATVAVSVKPRAGFSGGVAVVFVEPAFKTGAKRFVQIGFREHAEPAFGPGFALPVAGPFAPDLAQLEEAHLVDGISGGVLEPAPAQDHARGHKVSAAVVAVGGGAAFIEQGGREALIGIEGEGR